jgi:hypothetical protein
MTDTSLREIRERSLAYLRSSQHPTFLARLADDLTVSGRGCYPSPDTGEYWQLAPFICYNELLHVLADQLSADLARYGAGYPDSALVEVLVGKSRTWKCDAGLAAAVESAVAAAVPASTDRAAGEPSGVLDQALDCLGSEPRTTFLVNLYYELTVAARNLYPAPDTGAHREAAGFICFNELHHIIAGRLRGDLNVRGVLPSDPGLFRRMVETARRGGCEGSLGWALSRAVATMERSSGALVG